MTSILDILKLQGLQFLGIIPAILKAAVIFLIGWLLAKLVAKALNRLLQVTGIDALAVRLKEVEFFSANNINFVPSKLVSALAYYFILIVFAMAAVDALGMTMISDLMADFIAYLPQAVTAFVVLILGIFMADFVKKIILAACRSLGISSGNLISTVVFYFILLNVVLIALRQAQLQTEFMESNISIILAGVAGAFAIGYGLAAKSIMSNMLSGFYNRNRVRVGDEVTIGGQRGEVMLMNSTSLTLRSEESEFIIPFSKLSSEGVEVHSRRASGPPLPPNLNS